MSIQNKEFFNDRKVKEIKDWAKSEVKYFMKRIRENEEAEKAGFPAKKKEFNEKYPKGITSWYEQIYQDNETSEKQARLKKQFGYTDELLKQRVGIYHEAFWSAYKWHENQRIRDEVVMAKYKKIFDEAEKIAKKVDVSDIRDGFPCGGGVLYLKAEAKDTDLGKMLRSQYDGDSYSAKVCPQYAYKLPVKIPSYGQCVAFDEKIMKVVAEFLSGKGIPAGVYTYID